MVNVIIYLKNKHDAKELVKSLLKEKLIASASIDENNISYKIERESFVEDVYSIITAQTKALLFKELVNAIETAIGEEVPINSIPIVSSNRIFDDMVRSKTIQI